jgi:hypothetical protein
MNGFKRFIKTTVIVRPFGFKRAIAKEQLFHQYRRRIFEFHKTFSANYPNATEQLDPKE